MDGVILVQKPQGITSHDVVQAVRSILRISKVGHFGTLDPLATGLLILGIGKATRLFPFFSKMDKTYLGRIRLGHATDTYDAEGVPISEEVKIFPNKNHLASVLAEFQGDIRQTPPPYSAKKFKGKPLYTFARKDEMIILPPVSVSVYSIQLTEYKPPDLSLEIVCSSGTYIRSLAHDLGLKLECGGHLSALQRLKIGKFSLKDAHSLDEIRNKAEKQLYPEFLFPLEAVLSEFPKIILKESGLNEARNGNPVYPESIANVFFENGSSPMHKMKQDAVFRLFSPEGKLLAFARKQPETAGLHPFLVIDNHHTHQKRG